MKNILEWLFEPITVYRYRDPYYQELEAVEQFLSPITIIIIIATIIALLWWLV